MLATPFHRTKCFGRLFAWHAELKLGNLGVGVSCLGFRDRAEPEDFENWIRDISANESPFRQPIVLLSSSYVLLQP